MKESNKQVIIRSGYKKPYEITKEDKIYLFSITLYLRRFLENGEFENSTPDRTQEEMEK